MSFALVMLDPASIDAVARRVVEPLDERDRQKTAGDAPCLVDAAELARILGVSRATIYEHADELGAVDLGNGQPSRRTRARVAASKTAVPRPRRTLRFDVRAGARCLERTHRKREVP